MQYSNNPAIKRLMTEYQNLLSNPEADFVAAPLKDDYFTWHFTIKGPKGTAFEGGIYHGEIKFTSEYPTIPPDFYFLTPNGRFETDTESSLSINSFQSETWNPTLDIRTALISLITFMSTKSTGTQGSIDSSNENRRDLAIKSRTWKCNKCSLTIEPDPIPNLVINESDNAQFENEDNSENKIESTNTGNGIINQAESFEYPNSNEGDQLGDLNQNKATDVSIQIESNKAVQISSIQEEIEEEEEILDDPILEKFANHSAKTYEEGQNFHVDEINSYQKIVHLNYEVIRKSQGKFFYPILYLDIPIVIILCYLIVLLIKIHNK